MNIFCLWYPRQWAIFLKKLLHIEKLMICGWQTLVWNCKMHKNIVDWALVGVTSSKKIDTNLLENV
jgi:hypothetical protein